MSIEKPGLIIEDGGNTRPCIVSRLAGNRARISLLRRHDVPAEFTLSLSGMSHRSRVVWRTALQVGVEFTESTKIVPASTCAS
jgi:hypothetical protein